MSLRVIVAAAAASAGAALLWMRGKGSGSGPSQHALGFMPLIGQLEREVGERALQLLTIAEAQGIMLAVTSGYRSNEEQQRLYNQGRTTAGAIVTNAKPGSSWHNWRRAFDVAPINPSTGRPHWPENNELWNRIGLIGKSVGLSWGGDFQSFKDRPHFEYHPGLTIQDMQSGLVA